MGGMSVLRSQRGGWIQTKHVQLLLLGMHPSRERANAGEGRKTRAGANPWQAVPRPAKAFRHTSSMAGTARIQGAHDARGRGANVTARSQEAPNAKSSVIRASTSTKLTKVHVDCKIHRTRFQSSAVMWHLQLRGR